jgi:hypothetical protein
MNRKHVSAALVAVGLAAFAAVAYDATLLADALGAPMKGGEAAVALTGLVVSFAAVSSGLRGLWRARPRVRKLGQSEVS